MSAARRSPRVPTELPVPADIAELRARRRNAQRRRRLARVDLGLGVVAALALVLVSPGVAITGLIAALVLAVCVVSFLAQLLVRRRAARRRRPGRGVGQPRSR